MDKLPVELISQIMTYLNVPDRKEAALVSKTWYNAFLHPMLQRDIVLKCRPLENEAFPPLGLIRRKLTYLEFGDWESQQISEQTFVSLLSKCASLEHIDLSGCNNLFLSGRLLAKESDMKILKENLASVRVLKLCHLKYMTDVTFERLVFVMENVEEISLSSTNMIFGSGLYGVNLKSPAMLQFTAFLKFVHVQANKLKSIDLSNTMVNNESLGILAQINGMKLDEVSLKGCSEISDKGVKLLVTNQQSLKILDISYCKNVGNDNDIIRTLVNNLPHLHTLKMRKCTKIGQCDVTYLSSFRVLNTLDLGEVPRICDSDLVKGLCFQGPRLTSLSMPFCPDVSDEFVIQLCKSSHKLIHLDLSSCARLTDASLHAIIMNLASLQTLHLSNCREISDIGILGYIPENGVVKSHYFDFDHVGCPCTREKDSTIFRKPTGLLQEHASCMSKAHKCVEKGAEMKMLSNLKSLRNLDLSYCTRITDVGIAEAVRFWELSTLSLNGLGRIKDSAVVAVATHNPNLKVLELTNNMVITDMAVAEVVGRCSQLRSLDVSKCAALTDGCLKALTAYGKGLRHLDLSFNNLSVKAVAAVQPYLPKTNIVFKPHLD